MSSEVDFRKEYIVCLKDRDARELAHQKELDRLEKKLTTLAGSISGELRRLRAMVLRAHAVALEQVSWSEMYWLDTRPEFNQIAQRWDENVGDDLYCTNRAARLLTHWADAIEQGRVR